MKVFLDIHPVFPRLSFFCLASHINSLGFSWHYGLVISRLTDYRSKLLQSLLRCELRRNQNLISLDHNYQLQELSIVQQWNVRIRQPAGSVNSVADFVRDCKIGVHANSALELPCTTIIYPECFVFEALKAKAFSLATSR